MQELSCCISKKASDKIAHQPIDERFGNAKSKSTNFWRHTNIGPNSNKITKHYPYKSSSRFGCPVQTAAT